MAERTHRTRAILVSIIAALVFVVCHVTMTRLSKPIATGSEYNVLHLEFAWSSDEMDRILADWGPGLIHQEILVTWVDFGYLLAYGALIWGLATLVTLRWGHRMWVPLRLVPWAGPLAAFLDVVENVHLLMVLYSPESYPAFAPAVATVCATPKFLLVAIGLVFVIAVPAVMGVRKLFGGNR